MTIVLGLVAAVLAVVVGVYGFTRDGDDDAEPDTGAVTSTTVAPTDGSSAPTAAPLTCSSASSRCAGITGVTIADGSYVATYEVAGFDPLIFQPDQQQGTAEDHHVHFFFDTTAPENAGSNGNPPGDWQIWDRPLGGGELVFDGYRVGDEAGATRLCIAVADAGHAVELDSGSCVDLPTDGAVAPAAWRRPDDDGTGADPTEPTATTADWCGPRADGETVT